VFVSASQLNYNSCVKSRVLYAAFDLVPSPKGASTHITYFVRGLVDAGYDVTLVTAGDPALPERDSYYGATLLRVPWSGDPHFLKRALAFGEYVLNHIATAPPYEVIHVRSIWAGFPLAQVKERYNFKLLYEVNGLPSIEMKYHYPAMAGTTVLDKFKERELATLHTADAIITVAQVTAAYITSLGVSSEKITVIPNGFDPVLFSNQYAVISDQSPVFTPQSPTLPTLLYIGTLADWQGLDTLIQAMPLIVAERPAQLHIVGRGRKRQLKALRKRAQKLGVEEFVVVETAVKHKHIPAIIAQADICLAPLSYNDRNVTQGCCPLKIIEYMAGGKPIVAANLPVVRELVCEGVEALLFEPDNPEDMARQILKLLEDEALAAELAANAASRATHQFTWQIAQSRLLQNYQTLLNVC
jgi:glycosyltransferase involved in cell wall biosynthesis